MSIIVENGSRRKLFNKAKPFLGVIFLQVGLSGMDILSKAALNEGMSNYVFVVYRHAFAAIVFAPFAFFLDKKVRPKMTLSIFAKIVLLSTLEPVIDQNLYTLGMKYTTATFAAAMSNILPAITFALAWILRLEQVNIKNIRSQAKIVGTVTTIGGAMLMTLLKGPVIDLIWTRASNHHQLQQGATNAQHPVKGSIMMALGCFSWACFMNFQAITLKTYPAELSLTAWICFMGALEGTAVALVMERGNPGVWAIKWDTKLLAALYSGLVCSGLAFYIQGLIMKDRGPVFVTAFSPLNMVLVAILSSFILGEQMFLGRIIGAIVIVAGLYLVVWGKSKDYKTTSPLPEKQTPPSQQMVDQPNNAKNICDHKFVIVDTQIEGSLNRKDHENVNITLRGADV